MNLLHVALALLVVTVLSPAQTTKVFTSPDRALRAVVWTNPAGESRVQIEGPSRRVLLTRDETSSDGSHGQGVLHAAWTADSQFFVAGTESTGGHQPWARPIWVYSRAKNRVFELGEMGAVSVDDFTLKPPDVIEMKVLDCENVVGGDPQTRSLSVSLHQVVSTERVPNAPCPARKSVGSPILRP
jgi:hypothetical protein